MADHGAEIIADGGRLAKLLCSIGFDGDLQKLKFLIKCDANIEQADYDKRTLGHLAAAEGHFKMLEYLAINSKFNFDLRDRWNSSVLDEIKDEA